jgi:transcriptional regulator with XRE-family HTH domain
VIVKATRRARIERRETPHDATSCKLCSSITRRDTYDVTPAQIAERAKVSESHVYRVISDNPRTARGRRTLETLRRIAHDGLGISLDELAAVVLD